VAPGDDIRLGKVNIWIEVASARVSAATGRIAPLRFETERDLTQDEKTTDAHKVGDPT
jgi:hypothetical protein